MEDQQGATDLTVLETLKGVASLSTLLRSWVEETRALGGLAGRLPEGMDPLYTLLWT